MHIDANDRLYEEELLLASTIRDVAAYAGLSVGTVSKYINGKPVKESTRSAIEDAIKHKVDVVSVSSGFTGTGLVGE